MHVYCPPSLPLSTSLTDSFTHSIILVCAPGQTVTITNPLEGNVGSSLQIICSVFTGARNYESPSLITIRTGAVIYTGDGRLTSNTNETHKTYTLENLMRTDSGTMLNCGVAEILSESVTIQVFCKLLKEYLNRQNWIEGNDVITMRQLRHLTM